MLPAFDSFISELQATTNPRCRVKQCSGVSRGSFKRCKLCVRDKSATCRHHVHAKPLVNRRGQLTFGFDPALLTAPSKWFSDEAIESALLILSAHKQTLSLGLYTDGSRQFSQQLKYIHRGAGRPRELLVCLMRNHWFVVTNYRQPTAADWAVYDSRVLVSPAAYAEQQARLLEDVLGGAVNFVGGIPQQANSNDCGAFSILFAYAILYRKRVPAAPIDNIRLRTCVLKFLLARDTAYLQPLVQN